MIDDIRAKLAAAQRLVTRDRYHRYRVEGEMFPAVTATIGSLAKPALVDWAARMQMTVDIETAWQMVIGTAWQMIGINAADAGWFDRDSFESTFRVMAGKERAHQKILKDAGDLGTDLHALIEHYLRCQMGEDHPEPKITHEQALYIYSGFERWARDVQLTPICVETYVFSQTHKYAGALDCLAIIEGRLTLADWKVSKNVVYPEHILQNIAYRKAFQEMTGHEAFGLLVRLPKEGTDNDLNIEPHPVTADVEEIEEVFRVFLALLPIGAWLKKQEKARRG